MSPTITTCHGRRSQRSCSATVNSALTDKPETINQDPFVRAMVENFDATIVPSSIKPVQ